MKKYFVIVCLLSIFFIGCSQSSNEDLKHWMHDNGKVKVLSTTGIVGDIVISIGKEEIDHLVLIQQNMDPHSYELVKGDNEKLNRADLIFANGLGLEHGPSLAYVLNTKSCAVRLGDELVNRRIISTLSIDGQVDPHIWMDISIWKHTVAVVVEHLSKVCPEHAKLFEERGQELYLQLQALDDEVLQTMQKVAENRRYLVTSHDAFNYFSKRYLASENEKHGDEWKLRFCAPEGLAPDGQLGALDIQLLIEHILKYKVAVVFPESNVSKDSLKKIIHTAQKKGHSITICQSPLYGDSLGEKNTKEDSYIGMMRYNVHTICNALNSN